MLQSAVLYVKSLDRMVQFYQALGGEIVEQAAQDYVMLRQSNGTEIALLQIPDHIRQTIFVTSPPRIRAETPIKLIFTVQSIDPEGNVHQLWQLPPSSNRTGLGKN